MAIEGRLGESTHFITDIAAEAATSNHRLFSLNSQALRFTAFERRTTRRRTLPRGHWRARSARRCGRHRTAPPDARGTAPARQKEEVARGRSRRTCHWVALRQPLRRLLRPAPLLRA